MIGPDAERLLTFLVGCIKAGNVVVGQPETYLPYSLVHDALNLEMHGNTVGQSLEYQGMRELAEWLHETGGPAITGLIIDKSNYMPGRGYFEVYGKSPENFDWWKTEIKAAAEYDWVNVLSDISPAAEINYPDEIPIEQHTEGAGKSVIVNRYERDSSARVKCILHYGPKCLVCNMDFERTYGDIGKGFIHVHHQVPISTIGEEYVLDPIEDLRPLCPNCHAMIHRKNPPVSIEALKSMMHSD